MIADLDEAVGRRLRTRRKMLGLTQQQVANQTGVRFQQVQKYECASNRLSLVRFIQFCEALDVPPTEILEGLV